MKKTGTVAGTCPMVWRSTPHNPNTVQRAFADLERAGLIYTQRTAGKFVTEDAATVAAVRRSLAEAQTRQYLAAMRALGCGKQEIHNLFDQMEEQEHADL